MQRHAHVHRFAYLQTMGPGETFAGKKQSG
jgi:hypothetical protein